MTRNVARILIVLRRLRRRLQRVDVLRVWIFAVLIGAAAAYGVILFRFMIDAVSGFAFGADEAGMASAAGSLSSVRVWAAPVIGGFVVSGLLYLAERFGDRKSVV